MIDYDLYCRLRQAHQSGRTAPQIACEFDLHIQAVRKWVERERFERSRGAQKPRRSKLDPFRGAIARERPARLQHHAVVPETDRNSLF